MQQVSHNIQERKTTQSEEYFWRYTTPSYTGHNVSSPVIEMLSALLRRQGTLWPWAQEFEIGRDSSK